MRVASLLIVWGLATPLAAGATEEAPHPCARVSAPAERLACYDKAFPLPGEVVAAAAQQAQAGFGLTRGHGRKVTGGGGGIAQVAPDRIESRVVSVAHGGGGQRRFELDNGQVWMQADANSNGHVRSGDVVQLRNGALGSHQLRTPSGVMVRVRRVR